MENEMQNTVTQNAPDSGVVAKPAKKKGKILAITIPLVVVLIIAGVIGGMFISKNSQYNKALQMLDDGDISDAIEIHQKLGDYKDLADEICNGAESQCKKQLKKGGYSKIAKLYKNCKRLSRCR